MLFQGEMFFIVLDRKKHSREKKEKKTKTTKLHIETENVCFLSIDNQDRSWRVWKRERERKEGDGVLVVTEYWKYKGIEKDRQTFNTATEHNQQSVLFFSVHCNESNREYDYISSLIFSMNTLDLSCNKNRLMLSKINLVKFIRKPAHVSKY